MTTHNHTIMPKIKHLTRAFCLLLLGVGLSACLEKEPNPVESSRAPFALYKMNVTFIDAVSKTPISDLQVLLPEHPGQAVLTTDALGKVQIEVYASPPTPRVFILSYTDPQNRYEENTIHVTFTNPVFKLTSEDALKQGPLYQGLAEISITKELNIISR